VRRCQQHKAPQYLTDCVTSASDIASRQRLRSASRHQVLVPRYQAHLVIGPLLSLDQRLGIRCRLTSVIRRVVKSLSDVHWKHSCSLSTSQRVKGFSMTMCYINRHYLSIYPDIYLCHKNKLSHYSSLFLGISCTLQTLVSLATFTRCCYSTVICHSHWPVDTDFGSSCTKINRHNTRATADLFWKLL